MGARARTKGDAAVVAGDRSPAGDPQGISPILTLELSGTCLDGVPDAVLARIMVRSRTCDIPAGAPVFPVSDQRPRVGLVLMGTARSFLTAADGRQLTVRYARRGALVGKHATIIGAHPPLAVQALTDCTILEFDTDVFAACAATEIELSRAVNVELGRRLEDVYAAVGDSAFGSIRQRVIRHLLALAVDRDFEAEPRVAITQQQLADAIGSSREVVASMLALLRTEDLVRTAAGEIEVLSVDRLVTSLNSWRAESPY